ncbi:hypothetical protein BKA67DRAFT_584525 [Truncatella angustata]|uniref:Uncharacterized protein n=1 Tax=Truncatella angustata TaxID=152316 RepID=A0A9P8RI70_9PEZI|nr:uncharacterized protein BKA67DRAFT_584525 [Truncatella angustata]KAH6646493.1 hypothetical protein BKA67DRAFT_584525 [Truncatella angustata]
MQPNPPSPSSTLKSGPHLTTKANDEQEQQETVKGYPSSSPHVADKNVTSDSHAQWPTEGFKEMHLSGHEPRYFPGMMARASRRDSMRQGSMHESDDVGSTRSAPKKGGAREEPS